MAKCKDLQTDLQLVRGWMPVRGASVGQEAHRGRGGIDDPQVFRLKVRNVFLTQGNLVRK